MTRPAWPHGDPQELARSIVADPRFHAVATGAPAQPTLVDALLGWARHLLRALFHRLDRALSAGNPVDAAIGFIVIAGAFGLTGYVLVALARSYRRAARIRAPAVRRESLPRAEPCAADLRAGAFAAARAQRYRAAAALLFGSAIRALDERGDIAFDAARTPGEYRRIVHDSRFDAFAADAVVALFAAAEPRRELFERMNSAYDGFFNANAPAR